jgi:hypothetical protein
MLSTVPLQETVTLHIYADAIEAASLSTVKKEALQNTGTSFQGHDAKTAPLSYCTIRSFGRTEDLWRRCNNAATFGTADSTTIRTTVRTTTRPKARPIFPPLMNGTLSCIARHSTIHQLVSDSKTINVRKGIVAKMKRKIKIIGLTVVK